MQNCQHLNLESSRVRSVGSSVRSAEPAVRLPSSGSSNDSFGLENVFLGAFGVVHLLDLWNIRLIALRSLMGAWLFKTPVGPQAHYLKAELGSAVQEAKPCGTGKSSTASSVASMAGGMIYWAFLFRFYLRVFYSAFVQNRNLC